MFHSEYNKREKKHIPHIPNPNFKFAQKISARMLFSKCKFDLNRKTLFISVNLFYAPLQISLLKSQTFCE